VAAKGWCHTHLWDLLCSPIYGEIEQALVLHGNCHALQAEGNLQD